MTTPREMGWQDAIMAVLQSAEEPLDYNEITRRIGEEGLRSLTGATPARTVNRNLGSLVEEGKVARTGIGLYALPDTAERSREDETIEDVRTEAAAADPQRFTVKAYGLYWSRGLVDWNPTNGQIWGQQLEQSPPVNFADQDGIYCLHKGSEIAYVGQTRTLRGQSGLYDRLRYHHNDRRKTDRWEAFSWFGFRPIAEGGELLSAPDGGNLADVINVIEPMFIEAVMPRLNMRAGEGSKELRNTGLYFQSVLQRAGRGII